MTMNTPIRTLMIAGVSHPVLNMPLTDSWTEAALARGFNIVARVRDRFHLALQCRACGELGMTKQFTLRTSQPLCHACIDAERAGIAEAAGVRFLGRCEERPSHYGIYRAGCGHEIRRQFEIVGRAAAGKTGLRCEICHTAKEVAEAEANGWELLGRDPRKDASYRLYRHRACGHQQRVARANMQSNRFNCAQCGEGWSAAASYIYAMKFELPDGDSVVKLGFSRDPESRLHYQLKGGSGLPCKILRTLAISNGHLALQIEKRMHAKLRAHDPAAVIPPERYRKTIRVRSEIYHARLEQVILRMLAAMEQSGRT